MQELRRDLRKELDKVWEDSARDDYTEEGKDFNDYDEESWSKMVLGDESSVRFYRIMNRQ